MTSNHPCAQLETLLAEREWVRGLARNLVIDASRADDLEQETWLAAMRSPPSDASTPRAWLATVVRNWARRTHRVEGRRRAREIAAARPEAMPSSADMVARAEAHRSVVTAVLALEEPYRSTVLARFFEDMPPREIARRMQVPVETVRTRLKRALAQLRTRLDEAHGGDGRAWTLAVLRLAQMKGGLLVKATTKAGIAVAAVLLLAGTAVLVLWGDADRPAESRVDEVASIAAVPAKPVQPAASVAKPEPTLPRGVAEVRGEVWFASPEEPAPGVEVLLGGDDATATRATTNDEGRFVATGLPPGFRGRVRVRAEGFATVSRALMPLRDGESRDVGFLWLRGAASVRVVVKDFDGAPVKGAVVEARRTPDQRGTYDPRVEAAEWRDVRDPDAVATSDAAGLAAFDALEPDAWAFVARKAGFAEAVALDVRVKIGPPAEVMLHLFPGLGLAGRVLDREGRGIADIVVWAQTRAQQRNAPIVAPHTVTDAAGRYALDGLVAGEYTIRVARPASPTVEAGVVRLPAVSPFDVVLAGSRLVGTVRDVDGAPVEGAVVRASVRGTDAIEATSGPDGRYVLDTVVPAGQLGGLAATKRGYVEVESVPKGYDPRNVDPGVYLSDTKNTERDFVLRRAGSLVGRVTCKDEPVSDVLINVMGQRMQQWKATTDRDGRYRFDCIPHETVYVQAFSDTCHKPATSGSSDSFRDFMDGKDGPDCVLVPETGERVFDIEMVGPYPRAKDSKSVPATTASIHVRGRVTGPDGELRAAWVQAADASARDNLGGDPAAWMVLPRHAVARDGRFDVEIGPASGPISVRAGAEGCVPATVKAGPVADGVAEANVTLAGAVRITGRVVLDESDAPCAGAEVLIDAAENRGWSHPSGRPPAGTVAARTDGDGRFVVEGVAPGVHFLDVQTDERLLVRTSVTAPNADEVVVRLRPALSISGVVVFADGTPLVRGSVGVESNDEATRGRTIGVGTTASDGSFVAGYLPPGTFRLRVSDGMPPAGIAQVEVKDVPAGTRGLRIEVHRALSVKGRVTDADGTPVSGSHVMALRSDGRAFSASSLADGTFEILGLSDVEYELRAEPPTPPLYENVVLEAKWLRGKVAGVRPPRSDVVIVLPLGAAIEGVLVDASGAPLAWRKVRADRLPDQPGDWVEYRSGPGATTDAEGRFRIAGLASARYRLVDPGSPGVRDPAPLVGAEIVEAGATNVRATLGAFASISGSVVDENGAGATGGQVVVVDAAGERKTFPVKDGGAFEAKGLDAGAAYDLHASRAGLAPTKLAGVVAGSTGVRLVVRPGLTSTGRLVNAEGKLLAETSVRFTTEASAITVNAKTDADGRFTVEGLLARTYRATFWGRRGAVQAQIACGSFEAGATDVEPRAAE